MVTATLVQRELKRETTVTPRVKKDGQVLFHSYRYLCCILSTEQGCTDRRSVVQATKQGQEDQKVPFRKTQSQTSHGNPQNQGCWSHWRKNQHHVKWRSLVLQKLCVLYQYLSFPCGLLDPDGTQVKRLLYDFTRIKDGACMDRNRLS